MHDVDNSTARVGSVAVGRTLSLVTVGRLTLVPLIATTFLVNTLVCDAALAVFMVFDLADGLIARRLAADTSLRRATDSVVDRLAIGICLVAGYTAGAVPVAVLAALIFRDLYCGCLGGILLRERGVVLRGDLVYRALTGAFGVWAFLVPAVSSVLAHDMIGAILVASLLVAADYHRCARRILSAPLELRDRLVSVSEVRAGSL
ncbi:MAG TPA: CDP-alcohol phosphatidyltransferase family protein [Solirubrobacteraceae bacterium]|jgi:phosphatidylglycerophosphate synthase|nr:CDP-alcohol phosphatidyltransferase family protein [Solirubrobacteraceae bacterium]